mmetsp:Transcript_7140/g.22351  ORF Transcript_7140/g.22351 Transcript_7140/m.22351 type:complete len:280 (+) Transcript_7140:86-925(+)
MTAEATPSDLSALPPEAAAASSSRLRAPNTIASSSSHVSPASLYGSSFRRFFSSASRRFFGSLANACTDSPCHVCTPVSLAKDSMTTSRTRGKAEWNRAIPNGVSSSSIVMVPPPGRDDFSRPGKCACGALYVPWAEMLAPSPITRSRSSGCSLPPSPRALALHIWCSVIRSTWQLQKSKSEAPRLAATIKSRKAGVVRLRASPSGITSYCHLMTATAIGFEKSLNSPVSLHVRAYASIAPRLSSVPTYSTMASTPVVDWTSVAAAALYSTHTALSTSR